MHLPLRPRFLLTNEIPNARSEVSVLFSALSPQGLAPPSSLLGDDGLLHCQIIGETNTRASSVANICSQLPNCRAAN